MIRAFSFLQRHPKSGILYFRKRIPQRYRFAFDGKQEIKRSLRTCDKKVAAPRAMILYVELQNIFNELDGVSAMGDDNFWGKVTSSVIDSQGRKRERTYDTGDHDEDEKRADAFEEKYASATHAPTQNIQVLAPAVPPVESMKLATAMEKFCTVRMKSGDWTPKTKAEYEATFARLLEYFKNVEISSMAIAKPQVNIFCEKLQNFPPNATKGKFKGKTFKQILAMDYEKTISIGTYNQNYIQRYSALFDYAVDKGYCAINPFKKGQKIKNRGKAIDKKNPFTPEELLQIFSPGIYNKGKLMDWQYWVPLIALYSGARQQEIAQLRVRDIKENDGIHGMWITSYKDVKDANGKLKTEKSERVVPFHPRLLQLGLLGHIKAMREAGEDKLFPDLFNTKTIKAVEKVGRWFNNTLMKRCGLFEMKAERKISFHSLRHNFTDCFKKAMLPEAVPAQIQGREVETITYGTYGSEFTMKETYDVMIEVVHFDLQ